MLLAALGKSHKTKKIRKMKNSNLFTYLLGLAALGVTVYVVGRAWKVSQTSRGIKLTSTDGDEQATFIDDVNI